jgi:hypothetical protein
MTVAELAGTLAGFAVFLTFIAAVVSWVAKKYINTVVSDLTSNYLSELKPNSGSSMRDEVKGMRQDITDIKIDVAKLEGKFDQHIKENAI